MNKEGKIKKRRYQRLKRHKQRLVKLSSPLKQVATAVLLCFLPSSLDKQCYRQHKSHRSGVKVREVKVRDEVRTILKSSTIA